MSIWDVIVSLEHITAKIVLIGFNDPEELWKIESKPLIQVFAFIRSPVDSIVSVMLKY